MSCANDVIMGVRMVLRCGGALCACGQAGVPCTTSLWITGLRHGCWRCAYAAAGWSSLDGMGPSWQHDAVRVNMHGCPVAVLICMLASVQSAEALCLTLLAAPGDLLAGSMQQLLSAVTA
jgi:hypothetical protein